MRNNGYRVFLVLFVILLFSRAADDTLARTSKQVLVPLITTEHSQYCLDLLKLALSYSKKYYNIDSASSISSSQTREVQRLLDGQLDVIWMATSREYESRARPIRVPLYRGLLGYRIFIIRQGEQVRFDSINSFEDLQAMKFGQGTDWTDTLILDANKLNVVKSRKYENLFHMLAGDRFDAFPRGVHEPWQELSAQPEFRFVVEKNLAFLYRMPMYFFVHPDNVSLATDIEQGLKKAIDDGNFDKFFFGNQMIKDVLNKANLENRKVFPLNNPDLPPETPVDDERLWWSPLR